MASESSPATDYRPLTHWMAVLCTAVVFPLIWMGGLVSTTAAGMAVPDWPGTYGYNLFLYPFESWFFGPWDLFVEHSHRLIGSLAGLMTIGLVIAAWVQDRRGWFRWLTVAALLLVIFQGVLGGVRVLLDDRFVALIHGCVGPAFFAMMAALVVCSSRWWYARAAVEGSSSVNGTDSVGPSTVRESRPDCPTRKSDVRRHSIGPSAVTASLVAVVAAYGQLILGANLRHIAIDADPLVFQTYVIFHVGMAIFIAWWCILLAAVVWPSWGPGGQRMRGWSLVLIGLVAVQWLLGISTWVVKYGVPEILGMPVAAERVLLVQRSFIQTNIITGHVAVGSLILATATILLVSCARLAAQRRRLLDTATAPDKNL